MRGQEVRDPGLAARVKFPGRIFISCPSQGDPHRGVIGVDPDAGTWRSITDDRSLFARVSPDGRFVAMSRYAAEDPGMHIYRTSGEGMPVKVSERQGHPCWTPDGTAILISAPATSVPVAGNIRKSEYESWRVAADGSREERVPLLPTESVLDWSPDGRWLVTQSFRKTPDRPIYLVHSDGTGERQILAASHPVPEYGGVLKAWAHFSPDSRKVLFGHAILDEDVRPPKIGIESTSLLELDVESGRMRRFLERKGGDYFNTSCWSPDGKSIAVLVVEGNPADVREASKSKTHVEIVDADGHALGTVPLPGVGGLRTIIDWR